MGPLTSNYVLCGSREANEGKLLELTLRVSLRLLSASLIGRRAGRAPSLYLPKTKLFFLTADLQRLISLLIHATGKEKVWMLGSHYQKHPPYCGNQVPLHQLEKPHQLILFHQ